MTKAELIYWNNYYESGTAFANGLRVRMKRFGFFKVQFGQLIELGLLEKVTPEQMINALLVAPTYWEWWHANRNDELICELMIPSEILTDAVTNYLSKNERPKKQEKRNRKHYPPATRTIHCKAEAIGAQQGA